MFNGNVCVVRVGFWLGRTRSRRRGVCAMAARAKGLRGGNMRVIIRSAWELRCLFSAGYRSKRCMRSRLRGDEFGMPTKCKRDVCFPRVIDRDVEY